MGILDNIDQFFLAQTTMGKNARDDQLAQEGRLRQQQQQAQIEALLNTAGQAPATSSMDRAQALTGGGQLPQAPGLDPVTMARIGNVMQNPAVMGAAGQMQTQQNEMRNLSPFQAGQLKETALRREQEARDRQTAQAWAQSPLNPSNRAPQQSIADMQKLAEINTGLHTADEQLRTALDVQDWLRETTAGRRITQPAEAQAVGTAWATTVLPYLQKKFNAGAMQKEELSLFTELGGDPTKIAQLNGKQQRIMDYWAEDMKRNRESMYRGYQAQAKPITVGESGLSAVIQPSRQPDPSNLVPVSSGRSRSGRIGQ